MFQLALDLVAWGPWPIMAALNLATLNVTYIRHAEALHNAAYNSGHQQQAFLMHDPTLTEHGRIQAQAVKQQLDGQHFSLVVVSPLSRALETATIIFGDRKIPIVVMPELSEHCLGPNCLLSNIGRLKEKFGNVDFSHMATTNKHRLINESEESFQKRVKSFSSWLGRQSFLKIAVVSHGGFLQELIGKKFANAEVYHLAISRGFEL